MANKIKSTAPVVIPSGGTQLSAETVVFGTSDAAAPAHKSYAALFRLIPRWAKAKTR